MKTPPFHIFLKADRVHGDEANDDADQEEVENKPFIENEEAEEVPTGPRKKEDETGKPKSLPKTQPIPPATFWFFFGEPGEEEPELLEEIAPNVRA